VDAAATAVDVAETNVDIGVTPLVAPVDQVDPTTVSQTDPSAPPLDSNVSEAQPDTPPTDNPDVYAQNLAANLAGAPGVGRVGGRESPLRAPHRGSAEGPG
jgi:hypothetical protein